MSIALPKKVAEYFPYETVRPYQNQFIETVSNAVENRRSVLIEGSNGLGKTISSLSACLPITVEKNLKILYVARTHRQHDRVIEELKAIHRKQPVSGISLRGRHEMCLNTDASRHNVDAKSLSEVCEMMKAKNRCPFYTNMNDFAEDYVQVKNQILSSPYKASEIVKLCRRRHICPYELIKKALPEVNVVALSYLYVFDSAIRASFLKNLDSNLQKVILVVDEAHNLPDTAIDISSRSLSLFVLKQAETEARNYKHCDIEAFAKLVRTELEKLSETINKEEVIPTDTLINIVKKQGSLSNPRSFFEHIHEVGMFIRRSLLTEGKSPRSYIHGMSEFLLKWLETIGDDAYVHVMRCYMNREKVATARLEIVALDPSKITEPVFSSVYSSVIMSGTLQPLNAFAKVTKLPENAVQTVLPSPFPKKNVLSLVCLGVSTAMEKRTSDMYETIIQRINEVVHNTPRNTGIFTASFKVLNSLIYGGLETTLNKPLFCERSGMTSKTNERLVAEFKAHGNKEGAVFLGVQGGRTSEGVDFPGNQMNSVIVVGVPYAEPTPRVKAQIEYYEKIYPRRGREYGYILPAMKKASQAAGRPIRTLQDRGAIVFMDYRYATSYCRGFLPSWMSKDLKLLPYGNHILAREIQNFFNS